MSSKELSKVYESKIIEEQAKEIWLSKPYFHAEPPVVSRHVLSEVERVEPDSDCEKSFMIAIPPPNVTAPLHLGHALNNTLQDILIRFRRMQKFNTLWMPGTDHAGIATQTVVEKRILAQEGKKRTEFKREDFVARVQSWKDEYEIKIIEQLKAMGCSCDWARTRFTMDEVCAKAVRSTFFKLFEDGLIYRGKRLVNWDPATQTVLADDEVEHETVNGHFYYMKYPLVESVEIDGEKIETITVATTRPETMLGDTAIAMNPKDKRAKFLVGKKVRLPIVSRIIPIIADEHVVLPDANSDDEKAKFSTGFLKVTPAHDLDDYAIGQRHDLPVINIMAPDGSISDKYDWTDWEQIKNPDVENLIGMDRFEARKAIIEWFRLEKLLEDVREYVHEVGHSYRSHVPIEPYLSDQWYVAVKKPIPSLVARDSSLAEKLIEETDVPVASLAGLAMKPLLDGRLRFIPARYGKTYQTWLENLRDWPISRQLWWGHQIPIWYCQKCEKVSSGLKDPTNCQHCGSKEIVRDPDVLDTWFSSALWPFSTLGWPDKTAEMKTFYPTDVLSTGRDIITLWVSRMVMLGQYCAGDIPFSDVYIHAMIQDGQGRKMSKSLGNGIDPLVAIDSHGADAMRFTLASMTTDTQDIRMPVETIKLPDGREVNTSPKLDLGRNFCNKLWNASRFAMMNLDGIAPEKFDEAKLTITDKWILSRLTETIAEVTKSLDEFKFSESLTLLYKFFWNDLCDWYLEWSKPNMQNPDQKPTTQNVLGFTLDQTLRLLHPFVPFITEGIFQALNEVAPVRTLGEIAKPKKSEALVIAEWPKQIDSLQNKKVQQQIETIQTVIRAVRDIRNQYKKQPREKLNVSVNVAKDIAALLNENCELVCQLACLEKFTAGENIEKPKNAAAIIIEQMQIYLHDAVDVKAEKARLEKQKTEIQKAKQAITAKLQNENFVTKAKPEIVAASKEKLVQLTEQLEAIEKNLLELKIQP
ncbi:MAG: valine--tRNA ligase [Planctomycetes bacterium]|nr:valine--tRNA ligase [Planctomycetota bacterium]